jgi:hypothetical protein
MKDGLKRGEDLPAAGPRGMLTTRMKWRIIALCCAAVACAKQAPETTYLQADDLTNDGMSTFDKNEIVDSQSFTDFTALDSTAVQQFFESNPYNSSSFLKTYESNGVLASEAIGRTAQGFRLNPLIFLVRAEMEEGLIGEQNYPFPPSRVEYVFGCGCTSPSSCDPDLAGFDRQVDCLARDLRTSLDQVAANGATAGGWAPGQASVTVDGVTVTPKDDSTAALYQYLPEVGDGKGGNWLFWNIWQKYATFTNYSGPLPGTTGTANLGDPCAQSSDCALPNPICVTGSNYPGGMCTTQCSGSCSMPNSFCADFTQAGYCLALCNPSVPTSCRDGYTCVSVHHFASSNPTDAQNVCAPKT